MFKEYVSEDSREMVNLEYVKAKSQNDARFSPFKNVEYGCVRKPVGNGTVDSTKMFYAVMQSD